MWVLDIKERVVYNNTNCERIQSEKVAGGYYGKQKSDV